jgi:hypothetical protein
MQVARAAQTHGHKSTKVQQCELTLPRTVYVGSMQYKLESLLPVNAETPRLAAMTC